MAIDNEKHLCDGELDKNSVTEKISATASDGKNYLTQSYNLDAIISVGYRVNSARATQFRIWTTKVLKEYIQKGFVLDDDRLKQGTSAFGKDYFRELLERVRSIRASDRRIWQQITDIFQECSFDYDKNSKITQDFLLRSKTSFIMRLQAKPPQKSSIIKLTVPKITWDLKHGQMLLMGAF